jgi:hypothetical protein
MAGDSAYHGRSTRDSRSIFIALEVPKDVSGERGVEVRRDGEGTGG